MQTHQAQLTIAAERLDPQLEITFKKMFGGVCAYLDGRVFAIIADVGLALKLAPDDQTELLEIAGAKPLQFEEDGPMMKAYMVLPAEICADEIALASWIEKSLSYVEDLPAPQPRRKKSA